MRIGINASFLRKPFTGTGQVTINFLRKIGERSDVEFILYTEEPISQEIDLPGHFIHRSFLPLWKRDDLIRKIWWEKYCLPRAVKVDHCDVFISLYQSSTILPKSIRHIMVVHDIIPKLFPEYLNNSRKQLHWYLTERGIRRADRIVAVSHHTEKDLIQHLGLLPAHVSVVPIDVDPIFKRPVSSERSTETLRKYDLSPGYLYTGGGLEVRKNTENTLLAYKILRERAKEEGNEGSIPKLVISGALSPQLAPLVTDVERRVKDLNLLPFVRILGFVLQEDVPALYHNARAFLFPSKYEGFGLPVLEAMNLGVPIVTSKRSSLPEVGRDAVLYVDPDNPDDISLAIRNILGNDSIRRTLSERARERAKRFSWTRFSDTVLHIAAGH